MTLALLFHTRDALNGALVTHDPVLALKLKAVFESVSPEHKVNVHEFAETPAGLLEKNRETVNAWLVANGYDPLPAEIKLVS